MKKQRIHFVSQVLLNPTNPIKVALIGAGGTGSQMLTALARISHSLLELGHPGLFVTVFDGDTVSNANIGRQLFSLSEIGMFKGQALIARLNRFFGFRWKSECKMFDANDLHHKFEIVISCVDSVASRLLVAKSLKSALKWRRPLYWLDLGNSAKSGQAMIATIGNMPQPPSKKFKQVGNLPFVTDEFLLEMTQSETKDTTPSCSLAEALVKQDLFISSNIANLAASLLWSAFSDGMLSNRGFFLNLETFRMTALPV